MENKYFTANDWKLFKTKITSWQESYMTKLNNEYIEILNRNDCASEKFWALEKKINKDKHSVGVIAKMTHSQLLFNIIDLLNDGVITFEDLSDFSDGLKNYISFYFNITEEKK